MEHFYYSISSPTLFFSPLTYLNAYSSQGLWFPNPEDSGNDGDLSFVFSQNNLEESMSK